MPWTTICQLSDLRDGEGKFIEAGGCQLAVFLHEGKVHALDNHCPHAGANLASGWINSGCVVCPKHGWPFQLKDGALRGKAGVSVPIYQIRLRSGTGGEMLVQTKLPKSESGKSWLSWLGF